MKIKKCKGKIYLYLILKMLFLIFISSLRVTLSFADGIIIPIPPRPRPPEPIPPLTIKYHRVDIDIKQQVAEVKIDQVFVNEHHQDLEGEYIFPLPEEASISSFSMFVDGKRLEGKVEDADKAREIYEGIVRRLKDPALLEYVGRNMFRARVYPIPKKGEKRIELHYYQIIKLNEGICKFVYPLNTEKFSPKPLQEVTITLRIKSEVPLKSIYSPTHKISVKRVSDYEVRASFEENNTKPDKDFVLYYSLSYKDIGLNLLSFKEEDEDGFFLLLISPKHQLKEEEISSKNIVFVLDTSGSMAGKKIYQAKEALKFCINSLNPQDKFNIIDFHSEVNILEESLLPANEENKKRGIKYIKKLEATGGTNINEALISALGLFKDQSRPNFIIFLTDGLPTVGEREVGAIIKNVKMKNINNIRIFTFGVGYDVNTHLLDKITQQNKGLSEYIEPEEDIEIKISSFYKKMSHPVLSNIELNFSSIKVKEIYPKVLPDIFHGSQLILVGRYKGKGYSIINLSGDFKDKRKVFTYKVYFPQEEEENDFLPRIWATRKIGYLIDEMRLYGEQDELIDEIIKLSKKYGIITPYTSFLVEEDKTSEEERRVLSRRISTSYALPTGEGAVKMSKKTKELKKEEIVSAPLQDLVRHLGKKTFYQKEGIWYESEYQKEKTVKIELFSLEYFDLIKKYPEVGKYLSLKKVIFKLDDVWYQITE